MAVTRIRSENILDGTIKAVDVDSAEFVLPGKFKRNEVPSGVIDGVNAIFTLANTPVSAAVVTIILNGLNMKQGASNDYVISGTTVTFQAGQIPQTGDNLLADYTHV